MSSVLRIGSKGPEVARLQRLLNQKVQPSPNLVVDGDFGNRTDAAVRAFQRSRGLTVDGVVGPRTWAALEASTPGGGSSSGTSGGGAPSSGTGNWPTSGLPAVKGAAKLAMSDFERAARALNCEIACVRAVAEVEAGGAGFLPSGKPKILFEAHIFSKYTGGRYNASHPNISSPTWNRALYGASGEHQYERLAQAMALDHQAALKSASWGMFQIMGFNHASVGYPTVTAFVDDMYVSEGKHLDALVKFLQRNGLDKALREKRWADFARGYNGSGYAANQYDVKLQRAYEKYSRSR